MYKRQQINKDVIHFKVNPTVALISRHESNYFHIEMFERSVNNANINLATCTWMGKDILNKTNFELSKTLREDALIFPADCPVCLAGVEVKSGPILGRNRKEII